MISLYDKDDIESAVLDGYVLLLQKILTMKSIVYKDRREYMKDYYLNKIKSDPIKVERRRFVARKFKKGGVLCIK